MDALALLCNLHGDGPVTMASLRDIGCEDLLGLEAIGDDMLMRVLDRDLDAVARFRREARLLHERLVGEPILEQEAAAGSGEPSQAREPAKPGKVAEIIPIRAEIEQAPKELEADGGPVVEAVLELWRSFDHEPAAPAEEPSAFGLSEVTERTSKALAEVAINGLRETELEALETAGVVTLEQLAEADPLVLSRQIGLAYTHLAHIAFLARKLHQKDLGVIPAKAPSGPRSMSNDESAAGPFA